MTRALIEQWIPAEAVGVESLRERKVFTALPPLFALHVWWARRPLAASRAAVLASLLPAWPTDDECLAEDVATSIRQGLSEEFPSGEPQYRAWFMHALGILGDAVAGSQAIRVAKAAGIQLEGNGYGYARAFTVSPDDETLDRIRRLISLRGIDGDVTVLDQFAGGGSIPFEAARYGFSTIANELNPVASAVLQGTVDLPARLGPEFAETLQRFGSTWAERVRSRLEPFFTLTGGESVVAYIWAHTVPCPTTGRPTPLAPDYWLAHGKSGRSVAVSVTVDREAGTLELGVVEGPEAKPWGDRSTYKNGVAESVWTGETFSGEYIRKMAAEGRVGQMLLAVSVSLPRTRSRQFRTPNAADLDAIRAAETELERLKPAWEVADLIPSEPVPPGWKTDEPRRMGMTQWRDLFTARQLLVNVTALEELRETVLEARTEVGDEAARAVGLYLGLALDKACDYNGVLSSWHSSRTTVRNTFDRHDFAYKWSFAEFDGAHSLFPWVVNQIVRTYTGIARLAATEATLDSSQRTAEVRIMRGSAAHMPIADASVDAIVTDPPYYDNVMYAECSDYFYVWLKRSLRDTWPQFTDLVLTDKTDEAVANPSQFKDVATSGPGRKKPGGLTAVKLADAHYEQLLMQSFVEAHRVLKDDGVLTVMFTHKRIDAWDTLGSALLNAGFSIDASWPVHTESEDALNQARKNAATSTIFLACRKRRSSEPAYWADIRHDVARAAFEAAHEFAEQGMTGVDLTIATYGPVLSVLSERWPVYTGELSADGQPEVLRPDKALDLARERVAALKKRGLLGGRDVEFDRVTDWWLLAWSDFQAAEFPYDEARKLSIATHLELDDLAKQQKVVKQGSGSVTLLSPAQRRTAGALDPDGGSYVTWLDRLHALMLVYDEEGLAAARSWLARTGLLGDQHLSDVVEAALNAIPRVKDKGVFARPEARILDSMRTSLFDHIAAPMDESLLRVDEAALFEIDGELGFKIPGELGFGADGTQDDDDE